MDFSQTYFQLFDLPATYALDRERLDNAYRELQNKVHPDKFAAKSEAEQRVAMQWATRANEAYQTLRSPMRRATYLCELHGVDLETESNTAMAPAFLMQQMEWREGLDDARAAKDVNGLAALDRQLADTRREQLDQIGEALGAQNYHRAALGVRQLMFLEKFGDEVAAAFDRMTD